jgi:glycine oxidase
MPLFDALIAGAGIIGSSIAWRLAQRGLRVMLLDAGHMGGEASSAGAGMLAPGGEIEEHSIWNDFALESLRLYPEFVAELEAESGKQVDFRRAGAVEVAISEAEWEDLQARGRTQASFGVPSQPLSSEELGELLPRLSADVAGALFYPEDALVDPRRVMRALRLACQQRGVHIWEDNRVAKIRAEPDSIVFFTSGGTIGAPAGILAAGAWSSLIPIEGASLPHAFPVRGHLIGFHLGAGSLGPMLRHGPTYLLQRSNGFTIAGTSSEPVGFDRTLNPKIVANIHKRAADLMPDLRRLAPDEQWLGFRPAVEGNCPVIGRHGDTALWLAYGHYRNGILMAPETAARIAAGITASSENGSFGQSGTR